jgi:hypothetical protein
MNQHDGSRQGRLRCCRGAFTMSSTEAQERQRNHTAYRQLRDTINQTYAPGRFVAILGGQIVADAERFDELCSLLKAHGQDPAKALVVQAGVEYPDSVVILLDSAAP